MNKIDYITKIIPGTMTADEVANTTRIILNEQGQQGYNLVSVSEIRSRGDLMFIFSRNNEQRVLLETENLDIKKGMSFEEIEENIKELSRQLSRLSLSHDEMVRRIMPKNDYSETRVIKWPTGNYTIDHIDPISEALNNDALKDISIIEVKEPQEIIEPTTNRRKLDKRFPWDDHYNNFMGPVLREQISRIKKGYYGKLVYEDQTDTLQIRDTMARAMDLLNNWVHPVLKGEKQCPNQAMRNNLITIITDLSLLYGCLSPNGEFMDIGFMYHGFKYIPNKNDTMIDENTKIG